MQLFHIDADKFHVKWNQIEIFPVPDLISQLRKVLRIKKWDKICIQYNESNATNRFELSILDWTDQKLNWKIVSSQTFSFPEKNISMLIAMPNKQEKAELIVQKLTEIGVQNIYFWPSERSVIRQWNEKKAERLDKISREAVEQSRWIMLPEIKFLKSDQEIRDLIGWKNVIIANMNWISILELKWNFSGDMYWIVGPEWWFSESDLSLFCDAKIIDLGNNVLRMETASIVLAWLLKNI